MTPEYDRRFLNIYARTIRDLLDLSGGKLHGKIMASVYKLLSKKYGVMPAIRISLRKYKPMLEEFMREKPEEREAEPEGGDSDGKENGASDSDIGETDDSSP